ncbi:hypothetical protein D3C76_1571670 [compost metagenome]
MWGWTSAHGKGESQQLWNTYEIIRSHRQRATQQRVIGVSVGIEQLGGVVILKVDTRRQVQRVVAFICCICVICLYARCKRSQS